MPLRSLNGIRPTLAFLVPPFVESSTVGDGKEQTSRLETAVHLDTPSLISLNIRACVQEELLD